MTIKRGRKSAAEQQMAVVIPLTGARQQPPEYLTKLQVQEWRRIVDSLPSDYFRPGDVPLLAAYCVAASFYQQAASALSKQGLVLQGEERKYVNPVHQVLTSQASAMAQMAVKLRLCPSSRYSEKNAATKMGQSAMPARPWEGASRVN